MKNTQAYAEKSSAVESGKKRMETMVKPDGGEEDKYEPGETEEEEKGESPGEESAEVEAGSIMDSITDKPEVCHALYKMLEEKYSGEKEGSKGEKTPVKSGGKDEEFNTEGMD